MGSTICKPKTKGRLLETPEEPEVNLEQEIVAYCGTRDIRPVPDFMEAVAKHFYELGKKHGNQQSL